MQKKVLSSRAKPLKSKIRRVAKTSISDEIVDQIMSLIASGDLKPGQQLPSERELCKDFGAGRSSLREALRCLCIVGVLTARVGEGTSVALDGAKFLGKIVEWRIITEKHDIENLMEVRTALESITAANVARLGNEEHLAKLEKLLAKMETVVNDQKRFAQLDLEFHVSLAAASENFLIYDLVSMIRGQLERALATVLVAPHALPNTLKEHTAIVNAIRKRDPVAASESMQAHLKAHLKRYQSALKKDHPPLPSAVLPVVKRAKSTRRESTLTVV
ncbi:FadR family transcriptional regulator [Granulicella sp. WH15]|uniref:FadR/GntR family transcriptional regulator n=1 Tax=Granulicella sp. WH15 TaxID=2602070 RepID=UPI001367831E|nr:FadR/GntR family transcriptional regulator [Granulicella sp. WH15]QHN03281.1 FadR family transcriptional regulator [Granulicella sp. WH15]